MKFINIVLLVLFLGVSGCSLIKESVSDINGWDLSACVDDPDTCCELFSDNQERILGGQTLIDYMLSNIQEKENSY